MKNNQKRKVAQATKEKRLVFGYSIINGVKKTVLIPGYSADIQPPGSTSKTGGADESNLQSALSG